MDANRLEEFALPLQIAGFAIMAAGYWNVLGFWLGFPVHLAGDALFFFAIKRKGCL